MKPLTGPRCVAVVLCSALAGAGCGGSSGAKATQSSSTPAATVSTGAATTPTATRPVASGAGTVSLSVGAVSAAMRAGTHAPKVGRPWPVHFTVTRGGHPASATVSYEFVLGTAVVAHRSHYSFKGHFSDIVLWPSSAVGYPLTFRAVVVTGATTINLDYPVQVAR